MRINWYKLVGLSILDAVITYHFSIDKSVVIIISMAVAKVLLTTEMRERTNLSKDGEGDLDE